MPQPLILTTLYHYLSVCGCPITTSRLPAPFHAFLQTTWVLEDDIPRPTVIHTSSQSSQHEVVDRVIARLLRLCKPNILTSGYDTASRLPRPLARSTVCYLEVALTTVGQRIAFGSWKGNAC